MIWTLVTILLVIWILGLLLHVLGGFIYLFLIAAIIIGLFNVISGRNNKV